MKTVTILLTCLVSIGCLPKREYHFLYKGEELICAGFSIDFNRKVLEHCTQVKDNTFIQNIYTTDEVILLKRIRK